MKHEVVFLKSQDDEAVFLNGYLLAESREYHGDIRTLAERLSGALKTSLLVHEEARAPGVEWEALYARLQRSAADVIYQADILPVGDLDNYPEPEQKEYLMEVSDQRAKNGFCRVDVAATSGHIDDMLTVQGDVRKNPENDEPVPALHLGFDDDNPAASFYKAGPGRFVLLLEEGVSIREVRLSNGRSAFVLG